MDQFMSKISEDIEKIIQNAIDNYDGSVRFEEFEALNTMGEIIDRLCIINIKLYTLKNEVAKRKDDEKFCAWAANEDIKFCSERSILKNCINEKIKSIINKCLSGVNTDNSESKLYGNYK